MRPHALYRLVTGIERAQGLDISRYNKWFRPGEATQPIHFVMQKLTEGTAYVDMLLEELWQGVAQVDVRGGYHYQRSGQSWQAQADNYLNTAARHPYHFHALDLEEYSNEYSDTMFADTRRIIDYWREQTKQKVVLYTNGNGWSLFAASIKRQYPDALTWLNALELWFSWPSLIAPAPVLPLSRSGWTFWQYRWDGPLGEWGNGIPCDVNVFNGTVEQLRAWAGVTAPPPMEEPMPYQYEMTSNYTMSFRPDHNTPSGKIPPYTIAPKTVMRGDELWTAPADGYLVKQGDQWLRVREIGAAAVDGWVAYIHNGEVLCTLKDIGTPPAPTKPQIEIVYSQAEIDVVLKPQ